MSRQGREGSRGGIDFSDPWQQMARTCNAGYCFTPEETAGLVWCGKGISFQEAADATAPILWFSPDEPLLKDANRGWGGGLPEAFPWDHEKPVCSGEPGTRCQGRAYYLLSRTKGGNDPPGAGLKAAYEYRTVDLDALDGKSFYVTFLFFYNRDYGVNGHPVDLEGAEFSVRVTEASSKGFYRLNVASVKGLAHGLNWAANRLQVRPASGLTYRAEGPDTLFPLTLLVEEGKHATAPDRNGDGAYTPGYDVNSFVNDAWGVRDTFGTGVLARRYDPSHTKQRRRQERTFPVADGEGVDPCAAPLEPVPSCSRRSRYEERLGSGALGDPPAWPVHPRWAYSLRPACGPYGDCTPQEVRSGIEKALAPTKGPAPPGLDLLHSKVTTWKRIAERLPFSYRALRGHGFSATLPYALAAPPLGLMWAPKIGMTWGKGGSTIRSFSAGIVASPSVSRWLDWYTFAGYERQRNTASGNEDKAFVSEYGLRLRFRPQGLDGKLPLLGLRAGIQLRGLHRPREPRLVVELGSGFL